MTHSSKENMLLFILTPDKVKYLPELYSCCQGSPQLYISDSVFNTSDAVAFP